MKPCITHATSPHCVSHLLRFRSRGWLSFLTQQQVIVSRQFTERVTNAIYRIFERIRTKFAEQMQDNEDTDLEAIRSSVEGFMHETLKRIIDLLLPLSYWMP